jgi:N6-L-threonylcarbamoyladenine synthase
MANFLGETVPEFPLLNLVVSGGHSDLILARDFDSLEILGETRTTRLERSSIRSLANSGCRSPEVPTSTRRQRGEIHDR